MRVLAVEIGDHRRLSVGFRDGGDAGGFAHARAKPVSADDEAGGQRRAVRRNGACRRRGSTSAHRAHGAWIGDARRLRHADERSARSARSSTIQASARSPELVGREMESSAPVSPSTRIASTERRCDPGGSACHAPSERRNAALPGLIAYTRASQSSPGRSGNRHRHAGAIDQRRRTSRQRGERGREREARRVPAPGNDDVVVGGVMAAQRHRAHRARGPRGLMLCRRGSRSRGSDSCRCKASPAMVRRLFDDVRRRKVPCARSSARAAAWA